MGFLKNTLTTSRMGGALRAITLAVGGVLLAACEPTAGISTTAPASIDANRKVTVGLLAPVSSGRAEMDFLGSSLVNAARLARNDMSGIEMDLRIYPTGGDPAKAAVAARQAMAEGAQVLVGPLFSTATAAVAPIAAENGVSVLSFSNNADIAGNNVYLLGLTFDTIADRVVSHAVSQGRRNVGIIHSNDPGGRAGRAAAERAIARTGAVPAGAVGYDLSPQGISVRAPVIASNMRGAGADAVVFTDDPASGLTFLTPMLANSNFDTNNALFLGLTRWNVPADAASTPSMQGGVFAAPDAGTLAAFENRYRQAYGKEPHALAGLAYDGIAAVGAMIASAREGDGKALTQAQITDPSGFAGVNGIFRFGQNGIGQRGLALYRLSGGTAVKISSAPRSFGGGS